MTPIVETVAQCDRDGDVGMSDTDTFDAELLSPFNACYFRHDCHSRITALQAENEKLRELLGECDWLLKWANEHLMAFSNTRLETEFFSRREHAIERIQAALESKP